MIETRNLVLVPCTAEYIDAFIECKHLGEQLLGAYIPDDWPIVLDVIPVWQQELHNDPTLAGWLNWLYIDKASRTLVGDGGFKGRPDYSGIVEIGYAVLPEYRGRGYATEAAAGLIDWVFCQSEVQTIIAQTSMDGMASKRVLEKNGFEPQGKIIDPIDGELMVWNLTRERYYVLHNK